LNDTINEQIKNELESYYIYLSKAAWLHARSLDGMDPGCAVRHMSPLFLPAARKYGAGCQWARLRTMRCKSVHSRNSIPCKQLRLLRDAQIADAE